MANAKFPLSKMPAFTKQQMKWLRGYFYQDLMDATIDVQKMCETIGANKVILTIENQMGILQSGDEQFKIGG